MKRLQASSVVRRILLATPVAALCIVVVACSDSNDEAIGKGQQLSGRVTFQPEPFRLQVVANGEVLVQQSGPIRLLLEGAGEDELQALTATREVGDATVYTVATRAGNTATVSVGSTDDTSFRVSIRAMGAASATVGLALQPDERIYGLTERLRDSAVLIPERNGPLAEEFNPDPDATLDRRGEVIEMFVRPTMSLYAPFFHSSRGYGLWVEGTHPGVFDVGSSQGDVLSLRMETGSSGLAFNIFLGPQHGRILRGYHEVAGFPVRVPDWAFRHWRWRDELETGPPALLDGNAVNAQLAEDVLMYERFSIPSGVYLFDRPYLVGADDPDSQGFHRFEWDAERLPNIAATLESLRNRGYRLAVWSAAWARDNGPGSHGAQAADLGYLAPGSDRVIDLTNPGAARWWREKLEAFIAGYGIDAIKLDRGEEFVPSAASDTYSDGRSGRVVHNAFPVLQAKVHHDALRNATDDGFVVLARAGYSGSQQWAASWGGDDIGTELGLRSAIIRLQRSAFIGFPTWGSDTGGYYSFTDREVFARWLQFSALCPIMEIGGRGSHAPWDMPTEPTFDRELIDIYARYVRMHHDLIAYTAAQADLASTEGLPIARAMVFDFPDDARFADTWDQYMYGPDLLVAPVWQSGVRERSVLIPAGTWEWYWDRSRSWTGPDAITVDAPLDTLPLFIRAGASVVD